MLSADQTLSILLVLAAVVATVLGLALRHSNRQRVKADLQKQQAERDARDALARVAIEKKTSQEVNDALNEVLDHRLGRSRNDE